MDVKKDILWRVYAVFIALIVLCFVVIGKAFYIQQNQGKYWRSLNQAKHQKTEEVIAERGTIYSEDGKMLSTSIPEFDVYIDFGADGLRDKKGKRFFNNIDSLSYHLSQMFNSYTQAVYKKILLKEFKAKNRYYQLQKNISYIQYKKLLTLPLVRQGRNNSGFICEVKSKRLNPYGQLAFRTIGLARDSNKVGLELSYDSLLKGKSGSRTVRYIAGGVAVPVNEGFETEAENGKDIYTTIDVFIQEVTENALHNMMVKNNAEHGCAVVMETKTGKIKAIANLGYDESTNSYYENKNYSLYSTEPGSTFKLATMLALLDDGKINLNTQVNLQGGVWQFANNATIYDAEEHGRANVTAKEAFELSSNVGMAKMVWENYKNNPRLFLNKLSNYRLDSLTGIDIVGERKPIVKNPGVRDWYLTTLPWMSFGYEVQINPLQTLTLYNAIANNGKMMKPYLVNAIKDEGVTVKEYLPTVLKEKICTDNTLTSVKECLLGVCFGEHGTARKLFKGNPYLVAGKTGTSLVAEPGAGYKNQIYQSSFVGYFPADDPQYTCVVIIKNKPQALLHFGADVAGPVFKEISDKLYTVYVNNKKNNQGINSTKDSSTINYTGLREDIQAIASKLNINYKENSSIASDWAILQGTKSSIELNSKKGDNNIIPNLRTMSVKDALYWCETAGLKVSVHGSGKIQSQSIQAGTIVKVGQSINITLN